MAWMIDKVREIVIADIATHRMDATCWRHGSIHQRVANKAVAVGAAEEPRLTSAKDDTTSP